MARAASGRQGALIYEENAPSNGRQGRASTTDWWTARHKNRVAVDRSCGTHVARVVWDCVVRARAAAPSPRNLEADAALRVEVANGFLHLILRHLLDQREQVDVDAAQRVVK